MDVACSAPQGAHYYADWEIRGEPGVHGAPGYANCVPDQHTLHPVEQHTLVLYISSV